MYDILVIGSGIAGLTTALEAAARGLAVLLVTKERLEQSNTWYAQGGIAAALGDDDTPESHAADTLAAGAGLCDPAAVRVLVEEGPEAVRHLARLGVPFDRHGPQLALTREAAHSQRRIVHAGGDATGAAVETTLADAVRAAGIAVREQAAAVDLLVQDGACVGALLALPGGRQEEARAKATVLATGGAGQLYQATTNPGVATGDGVALAYRAGAPVANLEFFQFHPTALYVAPSASRLPHGSQRTFVDAPTTSGTMLHPSAFLVSEAVRGEGGYLRDAAGERFMLSAHPQAELAPRDIVARAIAQTMLRDGADNVFLDVTHLDRDLVLGRFPTIARGCAVHGIDITRDPIPVAPAAHYHMGGVVSDLWGRTGVPGLFACGEVAMTGVHGANRLASNSLLEGAVWGARIARSAGAWVRGHEPWELTPASLPTSVLDGPAPRVAAQRAADTSDEIAVALPRLMWRHVGIVREAAGLEAALAQIGAWRAGGKVPPALSSLLLAAELTASAALLREESRGAHARSDFPRTEAAWQRVIAFRRP
jgi:L-aspartate oxidase